MELNKKTIIIVGATGGIGEGIVKKLHNEGASLIFVSKSEEKLKKLNAELNEKHTYYVCDFTKNSEVIDVISQIKKTNESIFGLINAAGVGIYKKLEETSNDDWENSLKINVGGPFFFIRDLLPLLKSTTESFILTLGSGAGTIPMRGRAAYCSSKFALRGLILSLAEELKETPPHMCLITLGSTITNFGDKPVEQKTEEFKKGRAYFPVEWVANKIVEIIKDKNRKSEIVLFPGEHGFGTWKKP